MAISSSGAVATALRFRRLWRGLTTRHAGIEHVALGTFCHVATALRDLGLRRWTGPFDWIFSTPAMVADCLASDFAELLDARFLESVPPEARTHGAARQCRHLLFESRYDLPTLFNHHDPARSEADRRGLERAVGRMRALLRSDRAARFYMLSERPWPEGDLRALAARMSAFPLRAELVVVTVEAGGGSPAWSRDRDGAVTDLRVRTATRSTGIRFADPADDAVLAAALADTARRPPH